MHTHFDKCLDNVTENTAQDASAKFKRNALLDLAISMVHYVDIERLTKICSYVTPLLQVRPSWQNYILIFKDSFSCIYFMVSYTTILSKKYLIESSLHD